MLKVIKKFLNFNSSCCDSQETQVSLYCKNPKLHKTRFELKAPMASKVAVTGDFNNWCSAGVSMKKSLSGKWKTKISLTPGFYEYKYIVDGEWRTDPKNQNTSVNKFNTLNSLMEVEN